MAYGTVLVGAVGIAGLAAAIAVSGRDNPPNAETVGVAVELGFTPETLAACGVNAQGAESVLVAVADNETGLGTLAAAHVAADGALAALVTLREALEADPTDGKARSAVATAEATLQSAREQLSSARAQFYAAVVSEVEDGGLITKCKGSILYSVPQAYHVLQQTHEEWLLSEWALNEVARANREGTEAPGGAVAKVNLLNGESDVVSAKEGLETNLAPIEAVFTSHKG